MGLVEGITEWLPVSSTGHMILVDEFVKMNVSETFWNMFLVVIQLGAILAVCVLFFYDLNPFSPSKGKEGRRDTWVLWGKIVLGCIPAAAIGLPLNDWMEEHFYNAPVVALALIVYGVLFIVIENWRASKREEMAALAGSFGSRAVVAGGRPAGAHFATPAATAAEDEDDDDNLDFGSIATLEDLSWKTALGIGCFQVLSLVPGTSRSGSTIIGGLLFGLHAFGGIQVYVLPGYSRYVWRKCAQAGQVLHQGRYVRRQRGRHPGRGLRCGLCGFAHRHQVAHGLRPPSRL